jgi:hypothetical protein
MLDDLMNKGTGADSVSAVAARALMCLGVFGALTGLVFLGCNGGPASHFDIPSVTLDEAMGYAALACVIRYAVVGRPSFRHRTT